MTNTYKPVPYVENDYDVLFANGHYEEAIANMQVFLEEHEHNPYAQMIAHINIATCFYYLNKIDAAYEHVLKYKQLCTQYGNRQDFYNLCHISALIYEYEQHYDKAELAIQECIQIAKALNLHYELAESYNLYSSIHLILGNIDAAIQNALQAQQIIDAIHSDNLFLICQIQCNLALAYIRSEQIDEAHAILQQLAANPYTNSHCKERSLYLYFKGYLQVKAGEFKCALTLFSEARNIAEACGDSHLLRRLLWDLAQIYEEMQEFEAAFQAMRIYSILTNDLLIRLSSSKVAELHLNYNIALVEKRANIDSLSGVFNRSYLESTCNEWLKEAKQTKASIHCIVFDVDNFKHINDNYGHLAGDEVIKIVGQTCEQALKEMDGFVARYGGDEFVIILRNYTRETVFKAAQQLFEALTDISVLADSRQLSITISMGMVCNQSIIANRFTQLFKVADQALYMAKKQGKNQIVSLSNNSCGV